MSKNKCIVTVHSRVTGYYTGHVAEWNKGKREEFKHRKMLDLKTLPDIIKDR